MSRMLYQSTIATLFVSIFALSLLAFQSQSWAVQNSDSDLSVALNAQVADGGATTSADEDSGSGGTGLFTVVSYLIPIFGILGLVFTFVKSKWVAEQEVGTEKMARIANNITEGAMSFLKAEYSILIVFVIAVAALLGYAGTTQDSSSPLIALSFVLGAFCSALAGFIGMRVATKANVRTTNAARESLGKALEVAFSGGSVMGMGVVGLGVLGLGALFVVYGNMFRTQ